MPVGFAHAGFGANDEHTAVSTEIGTTYQLMLRAEHRNALNWRANCSPPAKRTSRASGAKVIYAGGIRPLNAFYLGLYGGSELPGVLAGDQVFNDACRERGYREIDRVIVLLLELATFPPAHLPQPSAAPPRGQLAEKSNAPRLALVGSLHHRRLSNEFAFIWRDRAAAEPMADVWFWDVEPLSTSWGAPAAGMFDLDVPAEPTPQRPRYVLARRSVRTAAQPAEFCSSKRKRCSTTRPPSRSTKSWGSKSRRRHRLPQRRLMRIQLLSRLRSRD